MASHQGRRDKSGWPVTKSEQLQIIHRCALTAFFAATQRACARIPLFDGESGVFGIRNKRGCRFSPQKETKFPHRLV